MEQSTSELSIVDQVVSPLHDTTSSGRWLAEQVEEAADDDNDSNTAGAVLSNLFLFLLIFGLSATVNIKNMKKQLQNKFAIGCGVLMQFLIMPLLGFVAVSTLKRAPGVTEAMGIALLVVTASPGGSYSNWWCSMFNADLALSVAMTTVSSLLSIGLLPANLLLYTYLTYGVTAEEEESIIEALDFPSLFMTLGIVLAAILLGLVAGAHWDSPRFHVLANRLGSISGFLLILFSLFLSSGGDGADAKFWNQEWSFYVLVAFPCLVGIALANVISRAVRLSLPETVAISIECCYQNTGIATSVAITMFDDKNERAQAVAVPLFYGLVEAIVIGIYCVLAWKWGWTKAPADENLCVVLSKTYEVEASERNIDDDDDDEANEEEKDLEQQNVVSTFDSDLELQERPNIPRQRSTQRLVSQGRWGGFFFPPVFERMRSRLFSGDSVEVEGNDAENGLETDFEKTQKTGDDANRNRFVSADYTAETSLCSAPATPELSNRPEQEGTIFNIQSLTIPEVSHELGEEWEDMDSPLSYRGKDTMEDGESSR